MNLLQDSVNGIMLTTSFGSGAGLFSVVGKVSICAQVTKQALLTKSSITQFAVTSGTDVSIFGWINPESGTEAFVNFFAGSGNQLTVKFNHTTGIAHLFGPGSSTFDVSGIVPAVGTGWYFFCIQLVGGKMGVQINNGTLHEDTNIHTFTTSASTTFEVGNLLVTNTALDFDEVCVFMRGLTQDEKDLIYNGGAGRSWP